MADFMSEVYSWIRSPEIQEHIRKNFQPDVREQFRLIHGAYRPIKEKLSALWDLRSYAKEKEDKEFLHKVIAVYRLAIREIGQCGWGEIYLLNAALQFGGDSGLQAYPFSYIGELATEICHSYKAVEGSLWDPAEYCPLSCGYSVEKWQRRSEWSIRVRFDLRAIDGKYQAVGFSLCDILFIQTGLTQDTWRSICDPDTPHPYPLPFSTGDLVYLDAPLFEQRVYGVLCCWDSSDDGGRHMLLGYIENGRFASMDLSNHDIAFGGSGYRVIDWLHSASDTELPAEQAILSEIGTYLRRLNQEDWAAAKKMFFRIFLRSQDKKDYVPYHVRPAVLSDLISDDNL